MPIPVVAGSKAWVCGRSLAEMASWNPAGGMGTCLSVVGVVCCQEMSLRRADPSSRGVFH
jgi:hypothetical protein